MLHAKLQQFLIQLRIFNWLKNLVFFVFLFLDYANINSVLVFKISLVFISFSFISSSAYIFNDIINLKDDQKHEIKKHRPIASNLYSIKIFSWLAVVMSFFSLVVLFFLDSRIFLISIFYLILNIVYSTHLKKYFLVVVGMLLQ